jgi:hypothetical protein
MAPGDPSIAQERDPTNCFAYRATRVCRKDDHLGPATSNARIPKRLRCCSGRWDLGKSARLRSTPSQDTQRTAGVRSETGTPLSILPCVQFQPQRVHRASRQWSRPVVPMPFVRARVGGRFTGTRGPVGAPLPPAAVMSDTAITCGSGEIINPESPGSL